MADIPLKHTRAELLQMASALQALDEKRRFRKIDFFVPYPKQVSFFDLGSVVRERMLRAGNQVGKSEAGAVEMTYHLTGEYPDDWMGHKFDRPVTAWACGVSASDVRDVSQAKMFGEPGLEGSLGTGFVPKERIIGKPSMAHGVTDAYDVVHIQHRTNGVVDGTSSLKFKSYEQGRAKFQGKPVDVLWLDEEPDMEIYLECKARTLATRGIMYTTFTPIHGKTPLFIYLTDPTAKQYRQEVLMTFLDVPGMSQEAIDEKLEAFPAYQRQARLYGIPMQGSGRVFITPEQNIMEATIEYVPPQWYKLWAIDFGIGHPFAAVLQAWDKDNDIIHILHAFRVVDQTPLQHCVQIKNIGINVPVAWPHDGNKREQGSGEALANLYRKQGIKMCHEHATFEDGGYGTEAGIIDMDERMKKAQYRVAAHLSDWFEEYRNYHRKDGLIVKEADDIMSSSRIALMAKRFGKPVTLGGKKPSRAPGDDMAKYAELSGDDLF